MSLLPVRKTTLDKFSESKAGAQKLWLCIRKQGKSGGCRWENATQHMHLHLVMLPKCIFWTAKLKTVWFFLRQPSPFFRRHLSPNAASTQAPATLSMATQKLPPFVYQLYPYPNYPSNPGVQVDLFWNGWNRRVTMFGLWRCTIWTTAGTC